ncbi:CDP-glycerol glycerophosphotransferase family protein [Canibacter zhoujuaniae]|uniref:CDP-glycerol glycerophosphotransferase family protein n=1 Tax=Canibacter zhoujuaniae TaxID=2708343 RepID=UPI0014219637|nr:CDP-glycerol glycerophosphotransferase family protein [Canibacter zhoujuaniae]
MTGSATKFDFATGNFLKLLRIPLYFFGFLLCLLIPRDKERWVFASAAGFGEGARPLAEKLREQHAEAKITWLAADKTVQQDIEQHGFSAVLQKSWAGFWATARAGQVIVTHGLGDANRYGIFGARVVQLWHGAPLKKLHLDSSATTKLGAPAIFKQLLNRMYRFGAATVDLYVAGSYTAATRLRTAFRVLPGRVQILGDPRHDPLIKILRDAATLAEQRNQLLAALEGADRGRVAATDWVLYAPTWRDGEADPGVPTQEEAKQLAAFAEQCGVTVFVRPHPLAVGDYCHLAEHPEIVLLTADRVRDLTPQLGQFAAVVTDYSSVALDFSLTERPIVWFAPDVARYSKTRGLYEPFSVTTDGRFVTSWEACTAALQQIFTDRKARSLAAQATVRLRSRFHKYSDGCASERVIQAIYELRTPLADMVPENAVYFESFYGKQASDNPLALDREIAATLPQVPRFWAIADETVSVPAGATPVMIGSRLWVAARKHAKLLIVNDWLRFNFKRGKQQTVLQTWHGTMLKKLALARDDTTLRSRIAVHRESRRWSLLLSQNPHSSEQFRSSYAYRGEILASGYPRVDVLANAVLLQGQKRQVNPVVRRAARERLGVRTRFVVSYIPTWRANGAAVRLLDADELSQSLGEEWTILLRGHTRSAKGMQPAASGNSDTAAIVQDTSNHADLNDVLLASDIVITDYSSVMFDASVAGLPQIYFVPDKNTYLQQERGFTFDFDAVAPGPQLTKTSQVAAALREYAVLGEKAAWIVAHEAQLTAWRARFNPWDDGAAASRVVAELQQRSALPQTGTVNAGSAPEQKTTPKP